MYGAYGGVGQAGHPEKAHPGGGAACGLSERVRGGAPPGFRLLGPVALVAAEPPAHRAHRKPAGADHREHRRHRDHSERHRREVLRRRRGHLRPGPPVRQRGSH